MPSYEAALGKIDQIEAEMKRIEMWKGSSPPPDLLEGMGAFGTGKISFDQWLEWVFVPRVRQIIAERGEFPSRSQVSLQAIREWQMWGSEEGVEGLIALLREFDGMFAE